MRSSRRDGRVRDVGQVSVVDKNLFMVGWRVTEVLFLGCNLLLFRHLQQAPKAFFLVVP